MNNRHEPKMRHLYEDNQKAQAGLKDFIDILKEELNQNKIYENC